MKKLGGALLAAALLTLTGCGGGDAEPAAEKPASAASSPKAKVSTVAPEPVDKFAPNVGERALRLGQPRQGQGVVTTLLEVRDPYPPAAYREPDKGKRWVGLRVRTCVRKTATEAFDVYWADWTLIDRQYASYPGSSTSWDDFPQPQYPPQASIPAGDCRQGWLLSPLPKGVKPVRATYGSMVTGSGVVAEWRL